MPLKPLPFREVQRKLEAAGFAIVSQRGSHVKFVKRTRTGTWIAIVPNHRTVAAGTLRSILRQAGLSLEEWEQLYTRIYICGRLLVGRHPQLTAMTRPKTHHRGLASLGTFAARAASRRRGAPQTGIPLAAPRAPSPR